MLEDHYDVTRTFTVEVDPMSSGLDTDVVLRLLSCENRPDRGDRSKYEK